MIICPRDKWAVPVHCMIQHLGSHPKYNDKVSNGLQQIADALQEKIDKKEPHKALVADLTQKIKNFETTLRLYVVNLAVATVPPVYAGTTFVPDEQTRYDPEKYPFGKLG